MRVPPGVADNLGEAGPGTSPGACGRSPGRVFPTAPASGQPWRVRAFPRASGRESAEARPALARAGVPLTRGRAQAIPRREGASFVSFLPLQQKIGHPPGTGASEASRGALRLPRESPRHAGGIIPPSCSPRPDWGILRARAWARVVDTVRGLPTRTRVADIVRGLSTPRGGYNARSCQQRASVPITNVRAGGPRRRQVRRSRRPTGTAICLPQWVFSRSDAVGLTQEATAGRAMSTMVALNGRPGAPGRLLTHGPRRARAQSHRSRQFA